MFCAFSAAWAPPRISGGIHLLARTCIALACIALVAACDPRERQQKPKVISFAATALVGIAAAQQADRVVAPAAVAGAMAPPDEAFALYAASSALAELEGARLVLKETRNADVRDYAQKLIREHGRAHDELKRIVAPRGLALPTAPTGRHADLVTKLAGVNRQDIDEAFLQRLGIDAHKETLALFERQAAEGKDPELRRYASQLLGMLREHAAAAAQIYAAAARR